MLLWDTNRRRWVFRIGKHANKTLDDVAKEDPTYLQWMFRTRVLGHLKDEFHHLVDVMEKHGISFEREPRKRRKRHKKRVN